MFEDDPRPNRDEAVEALCAIGAEAREGHKPGDGSLDPLARRMRDEIAAARSVILRGIDIMTDEQVGRWDGVRTWLEATDSDINSPSASISDRA